MVLKKDFYNTVLSQAISPCENYLIAGDIYGTLSIFHLSKITNPEAVLSKEDITPRYKITVKDGYQINSLLTTSSYLLVGIIGEIFAYSWTSIKNTNPQPDWTIEIPNQKETFENTDINVMKCHNENNHIFVGCGDNNIYVYDLETRRLLKKLGNHTDYIHCLSDIKGTEFCSGAEDGIINIWDVRTHNVSNKIEPHVNDKVARSDIGKWIGAVSINDDYVLCGGGPRLSLWYYRFLSNSTVFPIEDKGIHVADIHNEKILAGGRSKLFYQMSFVGEIVAEIPVSSVTVYSAVYQKEPNKVLCLAGSSPKIDICSNFMYKNQQLSLY